MKTINVTFEDQEFSFLIKRKADRTWREFILDNTPSESEVHYEIK